MTLYVSICGIVGESIIYILWSCLLLGMFGSVWEEK
jgi:hypothetical protein